MLWSVVAALLAAAVPVPPGGRPAAADPAPPGGAVGGGAGEMSLDEAVAHAFEHNPRVAGAAALVREAQGRVAQRRAARLPQAGVNNFVFRQGPVVPGFAPGTPPAVPPYRYNIGVFVSQVVFDWGQRRASQKAAERDVGAARSRLAETRNDVRLVVGTAFYDVHRARALLDVARERVAGAIEQLRVARARFDANVAPRFDVIRSEAELAAAEQQRIEAENDVALVEAAFNTALGRDVAAPVSLASSLAPGPPETPYERLREEALRNRPILEALRRDIEGARESVRSRRAENRPQVSLGGAYDRPNPGGFASQDFRYNVGFVMNFPFLDGGLTRGRVREAEASVEVGRQAYEAARQQVELAVRQAGLDVREAETRIEAAGKEVASAREALRVAQVRYGAGVGTTLEVTDAQVALARAGQNAANARFDLQAAVVRLEAAVGAPVRPTVLQTPPASPASGSMK